MCLGKIAVLEEGHLCSDSPRIPTARWAYSSFTRLIDEEIKVLIREQLKCLRATWRIQALTHESKSGYLESLS